MEKRTILAILLMFVVMVLWSVIESKFFPAPPRQAPKQEEKKERPAEGEKRTEKATVMREAKPQMAGSHPAPINMIERKEVSVETKNFWAILTNEDGRVEHLRLKKFEDRAKAAPMTIRLLEFVHSIIGGKAPEQHEPKPVDLVNTTEGEGLPLGVTFSDSSLAASEGNWDVDRESLKLLNSDEKGEITFVKTLEGGVKVYKRYQFTASDEAVNLEVEIQNESSRDIKTQVGLEWIGKVDLKKLAEEGIKDFGLKYSLFKNHKAEVKDLSGSGGGGCTPGCQSAKKNIEPFELSYNGEIEWYAFGGEYFAAMLFPPPTEKNVTLLVRGNDKELVTADMMTSPVSIPSRQSVKVPFKIYMGPKSDEELKKVGNNAEKLLDFGFFTVVARPILWFLNLTHKATGNYGIDIILVSILMKLIFLPLTQISFKSMKEMQKIQPEMKRLQETYKDDKARLQQEIMLLYKRRKVNPMSGCLPMVIQIPVFIALYNALQNAIEMRHAPFFLWIADLSAKDPLYISPIVMGASMVIQQKMTPSAGDPAQAKMLLLMPVMFTFMFLSFPSGLVIYWMVNNVLSIAHQYYLNKR